MIPIKIQCDCGQRYAFDAEPVDGRITSPVTCPICGADGTAAANRALAQNQSTDTSHQPLRIALPSAAPQTTRRPAQPLPGQTSRTQARHEARAKISWGDSPQDVLKYLMCTGFSHAEASEIVNELYQERAATIRANGFMYIMGGIGLVCVPIIAWFVFWSMGFIPLKTFGFLVVVGLGGAWMLIKGILMFIAPKAQAGDVAEQ